MPEARFEMDANVRLVALHALLLDLLAVEPVIEEVAEQQIGREGAGQCGSAAAVSS
jgi:hypothetical protein